MKRLWIGVGILLVLLAMGVTLLCISNHFYQDFSRELQSAQELALAGNWTVAGEKADNAQTLWLQYRRLWASFSDHEPVEELETLLSQLEIYEKRRLEVDFAAVCQGIVHLAEAIDESHNLRWWSIL